MGRILVLMCLLMAVRFEGRADQLMFAHGTELIVDFSVWNYGYNNPGVSPFPTFLELELAGFAPPGSPLSPIPGSSQPYYSGLLLQGWIQSLDGSKQTLLLDANAARLGFARGSLVASGQSSGAAIVDASIALSANLSQSIFGADREAEFRIRNLGDDFTIGLGQNYSVRNAISEPMVMGAGDVQTAGITRSVSVTSAPEPATWSTVVAAVMLLLSAPALRALLRLRHSGQLRRVAQKIGRP